MIHRSISQSGVLAVLMVPLWMVAMSGLYVVSMLWLAAAWLIIPFSRTTALRMVEAIDPEEHE